MARTDLMLMQEMLGKDYISGICNDSNNNSDSDESLSGDEVAETPSWADAYITDELLESLEDTKDTESAEDTIGTSGDGKLSGV